MHKKASSLAAALAKADRDVPKLDAAFDDETTRPVPLALIRMFSQEIDGTVCLKIALPDDAAAEETQVGTVNREEEKKTPSD
jgi:hypothetical protein